MRSSGLRTGPTKLENAATGPQSIVPASPLDKGGLRGVFLQVGNLPQPLLGKEGSYVRSARRIVRIGPHGGPYGYCRPDLRRCEHPIVGSADPTYEADR